MKGRIGFLVAVATAVGVALTLYGGSAFATHDPYCQYDPYNPYQQYDPYGPYDPYSPYGPYGCPPPAPLTVTLTADQDVFIFCSDGHVKLSINGGPGVDPDSGPVWCANVSDIFVTATGLAPTDSNTIDLFGVNAVEFSAMGSGVIDVDAGAGDDTILGNEFDGTWDGGPGADTYFTNLQVPGRTLTISDSGINPGEIDFVGIDGTTGSDDVDVTDTATTLGTASVSYTGTESRAVNGLEGNDIIDASATTIGFSLGGGPGDDTITGGSGQDGLFGDAEVGPHGNDTLNGGGGNDFLLSLGGTDSLDGQEGADFHQVSVGSAVTANVNDTGAPAGFPGDTLVFQGTAGSDVMNVTDATMTSPTGPATVNYSGIENPTANGGDGADVIDASSATVTTFLNGNNGDDEITGGDAQDFISGDDGDNIPGATGDDDIINGGPGNDNIFVDGGTDVVDGNDGSDFITGRFGRTQALTASDTGDPTDNDEFFAEGTEAGETITVTNPTVSRGPTETQTLSGFEALSVFANGGDDTVNASAYPYGAFLDGGAGNDTITGGAGSDNLAGGAGDDVLNAGGGSDFLNGDEGADVMNGGAGSDNISDSGFGPEIDTATYALRTVPVNLSLDFNPNDGEPGEGDNLGPGIDRLVGGSASDIIVGGFGAEILEGGPGNDTLSGTASAFGDFAPDTLIGGLGIDTATYAQRTGPVMVTLDGLANDGDGFEFDNVGGLLNDVENVSGGSGADILTGNAGANVLNGNAGADILNGGAGNDTLKGGNGADVLNGGDGNDTLDGQAGADVFNGGPGTMDKADYSGRSTAVTVTLSGGADDGAAGEGDNVGPAGDVENVTGGSAGDTITGDGNANVLVGGPGNDILNGLGSTDTLNGNQGNDTLNGGGGDDTLDGGLGADVFNGGVGSNDVAYYALRPQALNISIDGVANDGAAGEGDNVGLDVENLTGGSAGDTLTGSAAANTLVGGPGTDTLNGGGGNDDLRGGPGADTLNGGPGPADVAWYGDRLDPLTISIDGVANDGGSGGAEGDNVGLDVENVQGGLGNDTIFGSAFANSLFGGAGNDILNGLGGTDQLFGGPGDDDLFSNDGTPSDINNCGPGLDDVTQDAAGDTAAGDCENVILV